MAAYLSSAPKTAAGSAAVSAEAATAARSLLITIAAANPCPTTSPTDIPILPAWSNGVTEIPVTADAHRFACWLVHGCYDGSGRAPVKVQQMLLEVDGDPVLARHDANPVQGRVKSARPFD